MSEREQDLDAMNRAHGEHIARITEDPERDRREQDRALLTAIFTAARDQDQEGGQE